MTPAELKAIIGALVGTVCFFLIREFNRKDKVAADLQAFKEAMDKTIKDVTESFARELRRVADRNTLAIEELNKTVAGLAITLAEQKAWFSEEYVKAEDHRKTISDLRDHIASHAERFERELERHATNCPSLRG